MVINKVQLATYPDSLGGDLRSLYNVLNDYFEGIFKGGVHILPPFPSSGDRGFAPLTYMEIDPFFGHWDDIGCIGEKYPITLDLVVNHISRQSDYFRDFLKTGKESKYADMFLTLDKLWIEGSPDKEDISKIFLRRKTPYSSFIIEKTGKEETVWTTFGKTEPSEQIDLDVNSGIVHELYREFFKKASRHNVSMVRLDAIAYVIKKPGTNCFFVEPEIYHFLDRLTEMAATRGIELVPEVHAHYSIQYKLAERGIWIYDFILPFLILQALINHSAEELIGYIRRRPHNQITMLDCHDGIPVKPDLDELVGSDKASQIVDICVQRGANLSRIISESHKGEDGFDAHQIRCTYYSALDCNDNAYIAARAIQFFTPGIPQVYYVGLLAGKNDTDRVMQTGEGRDINRLNYTIDEIDSATRSKVVQRLLRLIRLRNDYPAFDGVFECQGKNETCLMMTWKKEKYRCCAEIDLADYSVQISYIDDTGHNASFKV